MAAKLYTPAKVPGLRNLLMRTGCIAGLLMIIVLVLYFEGGLVDSSDGKAPGFWDTLYFATVTITTVGYGDIVPVSTVARLTDIFLVTPVRLVFFFIFVGTAYQLVVKRYQEEYRMKRAVNKLDGHVIVCGCGATGRAAIREMLLQGTAPDQIVVLATSERSLQEAVDLGVVAVQGDASREHALKSVAIERAAHVLICPGRDDAAVLVALTVSDLNPKAHTVAMCHEGENVKLLKRSGTNTIISPAEAGGNLMAAATRHVRLAETMQDILSVGGALKLDERTVQAGEVDKHPAELADAAVVRVYRGDRHFDVPNLPVLKAGDTVVHVSAAGK